MYGFTPKTPYKQKMYSKLHIKSVSSLWFCGGQAPAWVCDDLSSGWFQCNFFYIILNYLGAYMGDFDPEEKSGIDTRVEIPVDIDLE